LNKVVYNSDSYAEFRKADDRFPPRHLYGDAKRLSTKSGKPFKLLAKRSTARRQQERMF